MSAEKSSNKANVFGKAGGFKILGIGKQEAIKYFFGGNATLAVILIFLIVYYLAANSWNFFPDSHKNQTLYRLSGQELTDYAQKQLDAQKELNSLTTQARAYELEHQMGALYWVSSIHNNFKNMVMSEIISEGKDLKRAKYALDNLDDDAPQADKDAALAAVETAKKALKNAATSVVNRITYADLLDKTQATDEKYLADIRASVIENIITGQTTQFIKDIREEEAKVTAEFDAQPHFQALINAQAQFKAPVSPFEKYLKKVRTIASDNRNQASTYTSAAARKEANLQGAALATDERVKARKQLDADRVLTIAPDYATLNKPLYESLDEHLKVQKELVKATEKGLALMPEISSFEGKKTLKRLNKVAEIEKDIFNQIAANRAKMEEWRHDKEVRMSEAVTGFFFGKEWVSNSSWHDFYGILPLLGGSVMVALVAITLAVPFAIGGAIYVNRLATPFEQKFVKPIIEFIGAIPSIVMAFLGVVVLGSMLQEYSQSAWLSWIPGFPVEGRLSILSAGVLLALMSVPTIFTLAEDALNNVPKAYKEAALALGSTNFQSVMKVILPSCASGIIAAVLLGFGRIIGETMVVLLVMGGRIAIPTSITDPAHSMTGILAQEIGEVEKGSLHWGALFMVGLVLFVIALTLNYVAQTTLKKLSNK